MARRGNEAVRGRSEAFKGFGDVLAEEVRRGVGGWGGEVERVVGGGGGEEGK